MAQYNPPSQNLPIFDSGLFGGTNSTSGSVPSGDFLNFPNAQGDENLLGITVADSATFNADSTFNNVVDINDDATFSTNIILSGTYLTNYIEFPDGSQQFSASGSGSGDALLSGGTSSVPQTFTGVNAFNNVGGVIIKDSVNTVNTTTLNQNGSYLAITSSASGGGVQLGDSTINKVVLYTNSNGLALNKAITVSNPTNSNSVLLVSDITTNGQLDISGQMSIGNPTNGNTVIINSDTTNNGQLDIQGQMEIINSAGNSILLSSDNTLDNQLNIDGTLQVSGAGYSIQLAGYGDGDSVYGLQVSGGGLLLGNNSGSVGSSYYVQLACSDGADGVLNVSGDLNVSNFDCGDITCDNIDMNNILTISNTVSGTISSSSIYQSPNAIETLEIDGDIKLTGSAANRSIFFNYTSQTDLQANQNYDENLELSSGISIAPNKDAYPSNTNRAVLNADSTTDGQLNVSGAIQTVGQLKITGSGNGITFPDSSIQTTAFTGSTSLATYTSTALVNSISPYTWSFTGISNSLGNQVNWILYSNSAITTSGASTVYTALDLLVQPSALNNYIFGSGTAIQIPYKYSNGTTTTTQATYYPTATVALGGFTMSAIADASVNSTFRVDLNSISNTAFTNGSTLTLKFYAN